MEARKLQASKMLSEKDIGEDAQIEMRLNTVKRLVLFIPPPIKLTRCFSISARVATQKQFIIDALDAWIPASGAEIVSVNEGTLGILGFVPLEIFRRRVFNNALQSHYFLDGNECSMEGRGWQKVSCVKRSLLCGEDLYYVSYLYRNTDPTK